MAAEVAVKVEAEVVVELLLAEVVDPRAEPLGEVPEVLQAAAVLRPDEARR